MTSGKRGGVCSHTVDHGTLGAVNLQFKATAIFGCIPDREESPELDSTAAMDFETSTLESDVMSAEDLHQDMEHSDTETSYASATNMEVNMDI